MEQLKNPENPIPKYEHIIIATPERRRIQQRYYDKTFPTAVVFPAVLGKDLDIETIDLSKNAKQCILENTRTRDCEMNHINSVGCALSHYAAWNRCIEMDCPLMIMEDDVKLNVAKISDTRFLEIFNLLSDDKSIVYLLSLYHSRDPNYNRFFDYHQLIDCENSNRFKTFDKKSNGSLGTQCYVVSPDVAKILIANFYPIEQHVDWYISDQVAKHDINVYIQKQDKLLFGFDYNPTISETANYHFYARPLLGKLKALIRGIGIYF